MIKKLVTEDIAQILKMDDPIGDVFPCDRGEWVQWLNQYIENEEVYMIGLSENGKLKSYAVAVSMIAPPLSNSVSIIFMSDPMDKRFREAVKEWTKQKGAKIVMMQAQEIGVLKKLGADSISYVGTWRV